MIEPQIEDKVKEWERLLQNNKHKDAEEYYYEHIYPVVEKVVVERAESDGYIGKYDGLITLVGMTPLPIIYTIKALQPKFVIFIHSEKSEEKINTIVDKVGLRADEYRMEQVNDEDLWNIFETVKAIYHKYKKKAKNWIFDCTGGRKIMSAGVGITSVISGVDVCYLSGQPEPPPVYIRPTTERLVVFNNVRYMIEDEIAKNLFNKYDFMPAIELFGKYSGTARDSRPYEILRELAKGYHAWDNFDYSEAYSHLKNAKNSINRYQIFQELKDTIDTHLGILKTLRDVNRTNNLYEYFRNTQDKDGARLLILDMYANALRCAEKGKYSDATLRLYRCLELIAQYQLSKHEINTSKVDLKKVINYNKEFSSYVKNIFGAEKYIPNKLGLIDSYILLYVMKDSIFSMLEGFDDIKVMERQLEVRNLTILVHGNRIADKKSYEKFKDYVVKWIEKVDQKWKDRCNDYTFIKLSV